MDTELKLQADQILMQAVELPSAERRDYVQQACNGNQPLLALLQALLVHLDQTTGSVMPSLPPAADPNLGRQLGAYQLQELMGEGGMGRVYRAIRNDGTVQQTIAIKLVSDVANTRARRTMQEWQILASLQHPNIAGFLDCGEEADGLAWLAMEFIDGVPIDQYCREHKLTLNERLRLFQQVCAAARFAHQNFVLHRDLKPGNILVTAEGMPKLLDFGIAKLLDPEHSGHTLDTATRRMTPRYASPEQLLGQPVATTSDVYSLGVILYELLTGRSPYKKGMDFSQVLAQITASNEPDKPSMTISLPEQTTTPQAQTPQKLRRQLCGDLDNIVLKALRYEASERYSSVEQLSEDIQRYLDGLPVLAAQDTRRYRFVKFVRRHRAEVVIAAAAILLLIATTAFALRQARKANEQAAVAKRERDNALSINAFFTGAFLYANPSFGVHGHGKGTDVKLVDAIKATEKQIDVRFKDQPEVRDFLHHALGQMWWKRGDYNAAEPHFRAVVELWRELRSEHHPHFIQNLYKLGLVANVKGDHTGAIEMIERSVEMMRKHEPENGALPYMLRDLGEMLRLEGCFSQAETILLEANELFRKNPRINEDPGMNSIPEYLARVDLVKGELERAEASLQVQVERISQLPNIKYETGYSLFLLGIIHYTRGNYQAAEKSSSEADRLFSQYLGEHPQVSENLYYLSSIHCHQKNYRKAEDEARHALELNQQAYSPEHPRSITAMGLLSKVFIKAGQPNRAAPILRDAMEKLEKVRNKNEYMSLEAVGMLGECMTLLKRYEEAELLLTESLQGFQIMRGEHSPDMVEARQRLDKLFAAWGKKTRAY